MEMLRDSDVGRLAVFCNRLLKSGELSTTVERTYWFPDKKVKAGDLVVLYTKKGVDSDRENKDRTATHFFYWGLDRPLWNTEVVPVIARLNDWEAVDEPQPDASQGPRP